MKKQTVYLPVEGKTIGEFMDTKEGYFFTPEQLNEYTQSVIKQALETAAENAKTEFQSTWKQEIRGVQPDVNKQSITKTFEETFKKFEV